MESVDTLDIPGHAGLADPEVSARHQASGGKIENLETGPSNATPILLNKFFHGD
jgi:hypothetical protein